MSGGSMASGLHMKMEEPAARLNDPWLLVRPLRSIPLRSISLALHRRLSISSPLTCASHRFPLARSTAAAECDAVRGCGAAY